MATVSNQLVRAVAIVLHEAEDSIPSIPFDAMPRSYKNGSYIVARAAIAALVTPEFVLPLAEEMLRGAWAKEVQLYGFQSNCNTWSSLRCDGRPGNVTHVGATLLEAYRAAKGE